MWTEKLLFKRSQFIFHVHFILCVFFFTHFFVSCFFYIHIMRLIGSDAQHRRQTNGFRYLHIIVKVQAVVDLQIVSSSQHFIRINELKFILLNIHIYRHFDIWAMCINVHIHTHTVILVDAVLLTYDFHSRLVDILASIFACIRCFFFSSCC